MIFIEDFKYDKPSVEVIVYHLPDAESISWDWKGFMVSDEENVRKYDECRPRGFCVDAQNGMIIHELKWTDDKGWI